MFFLNFNNLFDPPLTFDITESQFASSVPKPFSPVRFLTLLRDSNDKLSDTVILSGLSRIFSTSVLLNVCSWS